MKFVVVCAALICATCVQGDEKYTSKYNNVDLKQIMQNERLLNAYFKCLTEGDGCTPDGEELRKILPDAIKTGCEKCSDEHKGKAKLFTSFLIKEKPKMWEKLVEIHDPDKTFRIKFKEQLKAEGFDI